MLFNYFSCYLPAEKPLLVSIKIKPDDGILDLSEAILMQLKFSGRIVNPRDLRIFKTDVPLNPDNNLQSRALQWLREQPVDGQLQGYRRIEYHFPTGPHQSSDRIDIMMADSEVMELIKYPSDPYDIYNRKDTVHSPHMPAALLGGDKPPIHLGQPGGVPATIFSPALATLQEHLNHLEQIYVSPLQVYRATEYIRCALASYMDETHCRNVIGELIDNAMKERIGRGHAFHWEVESKGGWWYDAFLILVLKYKTTLGLSGDALHQAIIDYRKLVSRGKYKSFQHFCNFPAVLIGATANCLEISVAVHTGQIYVTKLLTLDLSLGFHASESAIRLARVFQALSCCWFDFKGYYDRVRKFAFPRLSCLFPNPTPIDPSKALPKLTYQKFLFQTGQPSSTLVDLRNATTAMYIATLGVTNQEVVVKFTAHYNEAAHHLLAKAQLAPTLHFCEHVIGDLYMVVMDYVDGKSMWQLQQDKTPIPTIISKKVEEAVHLLHENDIVFGDLREPNILYVASEDSCKGQVFLVDFDWAGKEGESRYPATLKRDNFWPEEVFPYGVISKAHDVWQVDRLTTLCNYNA